MNDNLWRAFVAKAKQQGYSTQDALRALVEQYVEESNHAIDAMPSLRAVE